MNIKSLLIGSVAALAAVSGAQAADAIIAAEPEAVEYVRVCDAFGTGFFYIPGTETCLQLGGYVRVQLNVGPGASEYSDYDIFARGRLNIDARNDTELGTLRSYIQLRGNASEGNPDVANSFTLEQAYFELAGFRVGKFYSWWDDPLAGETEVLATNSLFASVRYVYTGDAFTVGLSIDELPTTRDANVGIVPYISANFGDASVQLFGGYDTDLEDGAVIGIVKAAVGPGLFSLAGVYATDPNAYYRESEWTVAASYAFKATDKLTITPGVQYFGNYANVGKTIFTSDDAWKVGLTAEYQIVSGLTALATVNYLDIDNRDDTTSGFLRLQRNF